MRFAAILLLGGKGSRFATSLPKQFQRLGEKKVYEHPLSTFQSVNLFDEILVVSPEDSPLPGTVSGGATRQSSSYKGLLALHKDTDYVVIHDGVRPFVTEEMIKNHVEKVQKYKAVNTCIPSPDAINLVQEDSIVSIVKRGEALRGQTPQSFAYPLILEAHKKTKQLNACCDCSLILELGHPVHMVMGSERNFKITSQQDLAFAEFLLFRDNG